MLEAWGAHYKLNDTGRKLSANEIVSCLDMVDGLIAGTEPLTREVLQRAHRLKVISRCGTGLDNVDLEAARELGIEVRNTPDAHVDAVAELSLAAMLGSLRHLAAADRAIRALQWRKPMGRLLRGKTVGLIGFGRVGKRLVELLGPFEVTVIVTDPSEDREYAREHKVEYVALDELLERSDIVSLHVPYSEETHNLISRDRIGRMNCDAIIVNCARGGVIDEAALYDALRAGKLGGAYIDTFEREPYDGPLAQLEQVTVSPHIGSYAVESRIRMEREAVENLIGGIEAGRRQ